jgi:DNA ligase D-like protein (predicted ligase)/DNA ligase D-like protein (predicted polymerase)/DNA ligase D-like protein (predicted 3'-phosphoesterase)
MARTSQRVQVGKRRIDLSNLTKVLYPADNILKAELISYYLKIAPTVLNHVRGRALSLVRYPDGISGEAFFQKNRPDWAPEWIDHVELGGEEKEGKISYVLATEEATLVWLANLACIELHQTHARAPDFDKPDYFVIDLDPPEGFGFPNVAELGARMREHLEGFGYHPFVKTTGRKGLHIIVPLEPRWGYQQVFEAVQSVTKPFVAAHHRHTTLQIRKEARQGKVLIDIYRNRVYQTIVAAYSVRGLPGAPVSMPLTWERLESVKEIGEFTIHNVPSIVLNEGDPWEALAAYAVDLHTERKIKTSGKVLAPSRKRKAPETLEAYSRKRSFERTPEPPPSVEMGEGNAFVVHRHHASRLHYDLRLERDGVLKSWAVPRGLPPRPGIKRLAVATEDHPLEYLNFEGTIPKGEYGGGDMWVFARGKYRFTKIKKDGFYVRLSSKELNAEYRAYRTKENEWIIERVDPPQTDWLRSPPPPMTAESRVATPEAGDYHYEVKWDGVRSLFVLDEGSLSIFSRNLHNISGKLPELLIPDNAFRASCAILDGEIVCLDDTGRPVFRNVINRIQQSTDAGIERSKRKFPVVCYLFDLIYLDGRSLVQEPLARRRAWLADIVRKGTPYRISEIVDDGKALFAAAQAMNLEGIMAKEKTGTYQPGKRSSQWLKIKTRRTMDCVIIGYTRGNGERESTFGALQIAAMENGVLRYLGKVGTGFDDTLLREITVHLGALKPVQRPIREKPLDDANTVWVMPELHCEVQYASLTRDNLLREPVFIRMRPDLEV